MYVIVNNLPRVITWQWNGWESSLRPLDRMPLPHAITITPPSHTSYCTILLNNQHHSALTVESTRNSTSQRQSKCSQW